MTTRVPMAVGEVEVGDKLWFGSYDDQGQLVHGVHTVTGKRYGPPKGDEIERQVTLWFAEMLYPTHGDEGQTVYLATTDDVATADANTAKLARPEGK